MTENINLMLDELVNNSNKKIEQQTRLGFIQWTVAYAKSTLPNGVAEEIEIGLISDLNELVGELTLIWELIGNKPFLKIEAYVDSFKLLKHLQDLFDKVEADEKDNLSVAEILEFLKNNNFKNLSNFYKQQNERIRG